MSHLLWDPSRWTDSTQGKSPAAGQPPPAAVADAGVAARHCRGNGSRAVGRVTIVADPVGPTVNATASAAADDGFAKSATQTLHATGGVVKVGRGGPRCTCVPVRPGVLLPLYTMWCKHKKPSIIYEALFGLALNLI